MEEELLAMVKDDPELHAALIKVTLAQAELHACDAAFRRAQTANLRAKTDLFVAEEESQRIYTAHLASEQARHAEEREYQKEKDERWIEQIKEQTDYFRRLAEGIEYLITNAHGKGGA